MSASRDHAPDPAPERGHVISGAIDGFVVRHDGHVLETFPTLMGAERGRGAAREALRMLTNCLARGA